ncbi:MAG: outer membrane beta-barrel protein [Acidobacteriaceae bacterium]
MNGKRFNRARVNAVAFVGVALMLLTGPLVLGQNSNTGEIKGNVMDSSGAVIPGATVQIKNVQTDVVTTTTTNGDGLYDVPSVPLGDYSISFSKPGFEEYVRNGIVLQLTTIGVDAVLKVGASSQKVEVTTNVPLLQTEQSDQEMTLDTKAVQNAPIVGGVWYNEMTNVIPGVNGGGGQDASGQGIGINGTQGYMGNWLMEGSVATQPRDNNASDNYPPIDAIGEVSVESANYGAQYGNGVAAINVMLKSGTNSWHGSAFEFNQNDFYDAENYFQQGRPAPLRWNEFGGSVGGPIIKNKLFFYFTYQRNPVNSSAVSILTVPTKAMKNGDFSAFQTTIYNPYTTVCTSGSSNCSRTAFNGNSVPTNLVDPVASAIQGYLPLPNLPGTVNNYSVVVTEPSLSQWYVGKVDYNISNGNRLSGSVFYYPISLISGADALCPLGFDCAKSNGNHNIDGQITDTWTFNSNMVNEAHIGALRELDAYIPPSFGQNFPTKIGLEPAYGSNAPGNIFPNVTVNSGGGIGQIGIGSGVHAVLADGTYTESDVLTLIHGRHTIKLGGEFDKNYQNYTNWGDVQSGNFQFDGIGTYNFGATDPLSGQASTGIPYADFLLGEVYGWYIYEYEETGARMWNLGAFGQDDYQVTPKLVLNVGLRYQRQSGWSEVQNRWGTFDPNLVNTGKYVKPNTLGAITYGGQQGRNTIENGVNEFAPRVGFSWSPTDQFVVRGSYGIFDAPRSAETYTDGALGLGLNPQGSYGYGAFPAFLLKNGPPAGSVVYPKLSNLSNSQFNYQSVNYYPANMPIQYYQEVLLSVQNQLPGQILLDTSYVFTRGTHLNFGRDINQVPEASLSQGASAEPYPQFKSIEGALFDGYSNYNALQFRLEKRMSYGLTFLLNYAWSKTMDTGTSSGHAQGVDIWQNAYSVAANYGLSQLDATNTFTGSATYELPFGHGRPFPLHGVLDEAVGGWRLSSIFQAHTGIPFTPYIASADLSNSQANQCFCGYQWYPNVVGSPSVPNQSINGWFNPSAFAQPAPNTFGNERRNSLRGPGWQDVDLSVAKVFALPKSSNFELRLDTFDALNHPNFSQPYAGVGPGVAGSGVITGANTYRQLQIGGRLTF